MNDLGTEKPSDDEFELVHTEKHDDGTTSYHYVPKNKETLEKQLSDLTCVFFNPIAAPNTHATYQRLLYELRKLENDHKRLKKAALQSLNQLNAVMVWDGKTDDLHKRLFDERCLMQSLLREALEE